MTAQTSPGRGDGFALSLLRPVLNRRAAYTAGGYRAIKGKDGSCFT